MHIFSFQFCMFASTHATLTQRNGNVFEWGLAATVASKTDSCTELFLIFFCELFDSFCSCSLIC
jgi:hypothetical protein